LGNLDTRLQPKEKLLVTDVDFLRKTARVFRPIKVKKGSNQRKMRVTNNYGMTGKTEG
jgi:hypothetical protein